MQVSAARRLSLCVLLCMLLLATGALSQQTRQYDLNGEWEAEYHNPGGVQVERVMITQTGTQIVANKLTGDDYVPAGKTTIRGTYTGNPFPVEYACAQKGYVNPGWDKATITVIDATHLHLVSGNAGFCAREDSTWKRVGKTTVALDSAVLFDTDKSVLKPEAENTLAQVVRDLEQNHPHSRLRVAGYTDDRGTAAHNLTLSKQRATSVADWLAGHGLERKLLEVVGYGRQNPRFPNTNDEARAHNRRVEIVVLD